MKPKIGITLGDPAGIGPEIVIKTCLDKSVREKCIPIVIGDKVVVDYINNLCQLKAYFQIIDNVREIDETYEGVYLYNIDFIKEVNYEMGKIDGNCGLASYKYIEVCANLALSNQIDAIATSPINKESLKAGKVDFIGHTEILASLSKAHDPLTMFEVDGLRVFFLSRHVSLRQACDLVKKERIIDYVKRCTMALKLIGVEGTFAIAGLNPHSGENGLFGWEETNEIMPAIEQLKGDGYNVVGPVPADSVFYHGLINKYAAILSLYHDQGHIATKTYDFHRTIAVTHDMPILRTSVDHGTAFDIAGKNIADPISMIEATKLAAHYSQYFNCMG